MQLAPSSTGGEGEDMDDDEDMGTLECTIIPSFPPTPSTSVTTTATDTPVQQLFAAITTCANLHPDPNTSSPNSPSATDAPPILFEGSVGYTSGIPYTATTGDTGADGLPPPVPGSGGWITAENVGDYFDENGEWTGTAPTTTGGAQEGGLGAGAGTVRARGEDEDAQDGEGGGEVGDGDGVEGSKWQRTT